MSILVDLATFLELHAETHTETHKGKTLRYGTPYSTAATTQFSRSDGDQRRS